MKAFKIEVPLQNISNKLKDVINTKTKPLGALGQLENLAYQIGLIQQTLSPGIQRPTLLIFAGDHGITQEAVSPYPQKVTYQMVMNFLSGGAAVNVFARLNQLKVMVADTGVNHQFESNLPGLIDLKIGFGTGNFLKEEAMSATELELCIRHGADLVNEIHRSGCNCIGFGEMGIGNTSSASLLMHYFTDIKLKECIGRGTGLDDAGLEKKKQILQRAANFHGKLSDWGKIMQAFSGFEIATMTGAMLQAAENHMIVLLDGFIASSAYLAAVKLYPEIKNYTIACHQSDEKGHQLLLKYLQLKPLLQLGMHLGEGSGAAVAFPIVKAAIAFLNEMASFETAGISNKS